MKLGMVVHACHPSYVGSINRTITVQPSPGIKKKKKKKLACPWSSSLAPLPPIQEGVNLVTTSTLRYW
jgi:hypothetical protein